MTEIKINDQHTLSDIQKAFNEHFQFLKLEFYNAPHHDGEGNSVKEMLDSSQTLKEVRTKHTEGEISIHGNQKVSTLEHAFEENYGLNAQVFRKSGNIWLQTTTTDEWTLTEQNKTAKEFSR